MPHLVVRPDASAELRRITLLRIGQARGWWTYESANPAPHVDRAGRRYDVPTYTLALPDGFERVLLADEVLGYVLATADQYGESGVAAIAYRDTLLPYPGSSD